MRKLTLQDWNKIYFAKPRCLKTLYEYIRDCRILPPPKKVGKAYEVAENAIFIDAYNQNKHLSLAERVESGKKKERKKQRPAG